MFQRRRGTTVDPVDSCRSSCGAGAVLTSQPILSTSAIIVSGDVTSVDTPKPLRCCWRRSTLAEIQQCRSGAEDLKPFRCRWRTRLTRWVPAEPPRRIRLIPEFQHELPWWLGRLLPMSQSCQYPDEPVESPLIRCAAADEPLDFDRGSRRAWTVLMIQLMFWW